MCERVVKWVPRMRSSVGSELVRDEVVVVASDEGCCSQACEIVLLKDDHQYSSATSSSRSWMSLGQEATHKLPPRRPSSAPNMASRPSRRARSWTLAPFSSGSKSFSPRFGMTICPSLSFFLPLEKEASRRPDRGCQLRKAGTGHGVELQWGQTAWRAGGSRPRRRRPSRSRHRSRPS